MKDLRAQQTDRVVIQLNKANRKPAGMLTEQPGWGSRFEIQRYR